MSSVYVRKSYYTCVWVEGCAPCGRTFFADVDAGAMRLFGDNGERGERPLPLPFPLAGESGGCAARHGVGRQGPLYMGHAALRRARTWGMWVLA